MALMGVVTVSTVVRSSKLDQCGSHRDETQGQEAFGPNPLHEQDLLIHGLGDPEPSSVSPHSHASKGAPAWVTLRQGQSAPTVIQVKVP